jgi:hypothetical protein
MTDDNAKKGKTEVGTVETTRIDAEILRALGFEPDTLAIDVSRSVEGISDAIAARVRARLASEGCKPSDAYLTDEETPDPDQETEERATDEWAKRNRRGP